MLWLQDMEDTSMLVIIGFTRDCIIAYDHSILNRMLKEAFMSQDNWEDLNIIDKLNLINTSIMEAVNDTSN